MSTYRLIIPGRLPGLNEYIAVERRNRHAAAAMKKGTQRIINKEIAVQLRRIRIKKQVFVRYLWVEKNKRRDKDNVAFARKFIQDSLVACQVLENDGWANIAGFSDEFAVDNKNPRVEVTITEIE